MLLVIAVFLLLGCDWFMLLQAGSAEPADFPLALQRINQAFHSSTNLNFLEVYNCILMFKAILHYQK